MRRAEKGEERGKEKRGRGGGEKEGRGGGRREGEERGGKQERGRERREGGSGGKVEGGAACQATLLYCACSRNARSQKRHPICKLQKKVKIERV